MLEFIIYAIIGAGIVWCGISIYERVRRQRERDAELAERLAYKQAKDAEEAAYVAAMAKQFAEKHPDIEEPITKRTIESPSRVVSSNVLRVSEKKLIRDSYPPVYHSDNHCDIDCVPLVDTVAVAAAFALADQVLHREEQIFVPQGGQFDGGGASDSYEDAHDRLRAAAESYEPPKQDYFDGGAMTSSYEPPSYSEPDSSSSWSSDDDT